MSDDTEYIEDIDYDLVVTMVYNLEVTGDAGTVKVFLSRHQYIASSTETRAVDCTGCGEIYNKRRMLHYLVVINEETFYLPEVSIAIEGRVKPWYEQDRKGWMERNSDQPRDFIGEYKKITGIDLQQRAIHQEHNGFDQWEEFQKNKGKDNGKQYGPGWKADPEEFQKDPY